MTEILGVRIDATASELATQQVVEWATASASRFVCAANVYTLMLAHDEIDFRALVNAADLVTPDGMPLVWLMRLRGVRQQQRVYGPDLMKAVLAAAARDGIAVGFLGGAPDVLETLVAIASRRHPEMKIAFHYSPPYREATSTEDSELTQKLNESGARILFVGLGCPKQERWISAHRDSVHCVMLGVGAAFDFLAGSKPQAPKWMQTVGLEWLFRFASEPARLARRYLYYNPRFIFLSIADLLSHPR